MRTIKIVETLFLTILIISFGILVYCIYISANVDNMGWTEGEYEAETLSTKVKANDEVIKSKSNISDVIETVNESVVGISKLKNKGNTIFLADGDSSLGLGTGFIISDDGYILTNEHVAGEKLSNCYITLENGTMHTGEVVWADRDVDLSIIKIKAEGLKSLELGDSDSLKITQTVYAIGNPVGFEFQRTVTSGIISGLDRTIKLTEDDENFFMEDLIQTDAKINPGNSGGPLINENGEVIGINSVKITNAEGIGFAIPINIIKPVITNIKENQNYKAAALGIYGYDKNVIPYIKQDLGIRQSLDKGIYVAEVIRNSPAYKAGLKEGDILLKIDNIEVHKMSDLRKYIYSKQENDSVVINYLRGKKETEAEITLARK